MSLNDYKARLREHDGTVSEFPLSLYPQQYIEDLLENHDESLQYVADFLEELEYFPGCCPDRLIDVRGQLLVNGDYAEVVHIGQAEYPFEDWSSNAHGGASPCSRIEEVYHWCREHCQGVWIITSAQHVTSWDLPFEVGIVFLDPADRAAFDANAWEFEA